jgi:uncharacterized protein
MSLTPDRARELEALLRRNWTLWTILERAPALALQAYYLVAGAVVQTVWNVQSGQQPEANLKDYDLVYFDPRDLSFEAEDVVVRKARALYTDVRPAGCALPLDIHNEARVHLWYEDHFGTPIPPYHSVEHAIDSFPTIATCVGVRLDPARGLRVYAPYGLGDLLSGIVRPNKRQITQEIYEKKVARWRSSWPHLRIAAWSEDARASG